MRNKQVQVFCDFDGTITVGDTVDLLLERLALPEWKAIESLWESGRISARECMSMQIPLIQGGWPAIERVLQDVKLDQGFKTFVTWCRRRDIPFYIVSDGLDRVVRYLLDRENVLVDGVWANTLIENEDNSLMLDFPQRGERIVCPSGRCKCQILDRAPRDATKVVIGDGRSDFCWASGADVLFARDKLLAHCRAGGIDCTGFESLLEVRLALQEVIPEPTRAAEEYKETGRNRQPADTANKPVVPLVEASLWAGA